MLIMKSREKPHHHLPPTRKWSGGTSQQRMVNALRTLLLHRDEINWDVLLPHIMRSFRAVPHGSTGKSANYLMFGRELNLPETLIAGPQGPRTTRSQYSVDLDKRLEHTYAFEREQQKTTLDKDPGTEPMFTLHDFVWTKANRCRKGTSRKLQPRYTGPYQIIAVYDNGTYLINQGGRQSVINECNLKLYSPATNNWGRSPRIHEPHQIALTYSNRPPKAAEIPEIIETPRNLSKSRPETDKLISKLETTKLITTPERVEIEREQTPTATIPLGFPGKEKETENRTTPTKKIYCPDQEDNSKSTPTGSVKKLPTHLQDHDLSHVQLAPPISKQTPPIRRVAGMILNGDEYESEFLPLFTLNKLTCSPQIHHSTSNYRISKTHSPKTNMDNSNTELNIFTDQEYPEDTPAAAQG